MKVIGLTGGIASGKSTVAAMLRNANIPVIDADVLARDAVKKGSQCLKDIVAVFGDEVIERDGSLNRKKLASIIFNDAAQRKKLEAILHPKIEAMRAEQVSELAARGHTVVVYMAPLIFESGLHERLTKTMLVTASDSVKMQRLKTRDGFSPEEAQKRMSAQFDDEVKARMADEVVENNDTEDALFKNLQAAWRRLTGIILPEKPSTMSRPSAKNSTDDK